jgi:hypothetical protein
MLCETVYILTLYIVIFMLLPAGMKYKELMSFVISIYLYMLYNSVPREYFHFEVSPWKKTCLNDRIGCNSNRCPQCCSRGFNGRDVRFEYTPMEQRMDISCPCPDGPENYPHDYARLKNVR